MIAFGCVGIRSRRFGDAHGVARLVKLQRQSPVGLQVQRIRQTLILAALQQFVLGVDRLDFAGRVGARHVLHHNQVARLSDRVVRFGGDYQPEHLQLGGDFQFALRAIQKDLTQVGGAAFRRDGPQDISEVLGSVLGRRLQAGEFHIDLDAALLALDSGLAASAGKQIRSQKIDLRRAAAVLIADCLGGAGSHGHAINRWRSSGHSGRVLILLLRPLGR